MSSLITMKQLMGMSGLSHSEIINAIESRSLPKPLPLGPWNFGWDEKVIKNWLLSKEQ
jgi:predicted DNA-binding transcriptional regulator AlpA